MAVLKLPPSDTTHKVQPTKRRKKKHHSQNPKHKQQQQKQQNTTTTTTTTSSSWDQIKNLLKCKQMDVTVTVSGSDQKGSNSNNGYSKLSSCSSICSFRDVVNNGNITTTRVVHRGDDSNSPESSTVGQDSGLLKKKKHGGNGSPAVRSNGHGSYTSASRGMQLRKLSGCYECHAIVDPSRHAIPRSTICLCSECGEVFPKMESLEHHQAVKHAVLELGPEDSGRNIVEIIFKSSWQNKNHPIFTIERILTVNNTRRTIQRFEDCRNTIKIRSTATATTRCAADGNELLRFHCTTLGCSLGSNGSSKLCGSFPGCGVCTVIRHGFQSPKSDDGTQKGVCTTASSGRAHDCLAVPARGVKAMLVCRVIAGKVKRVEGNVVEDGPYDSMAGYPGSYSNIEELYVYNPRAILPCFVVIYKAVEC